MAGAEWAKAAQPEIDTCPFLQQRPFALHSSTMATMESISLWATARGHDLGGKNKQVVLGKGPQRAFFYQTLYVSEYKVESTELLISKELGRKMDQGES